MGDVPVIGAAWLKPDYRAALEKAGARIRELSPADALPGALSDCDGLLFTGGLDVDPALYGETPHPTVEIDAARDAYEMDLARIALERNLPVLAICRGVQVLNVAGGGSLIQDIPSAIASPVEHQIATPKSAIAHPITTAGGTCLSALLSPRLDHNRTINVNSRHHQSIDRVAIGFIVSATAPDGVIEAIEKPGATFCVGVQWHPENFWQTGEFDELFTGLVRAARQGRT